MHEQIVPDIRIVPVLERYTNFKYNSCQIIETTTSYNLEWN